MQLVVPVLYASHNDGHPLKPIADNVIIDAAVLSLSAYARVHAKEALVLMHELQYYNQPKGVDLNGDKSIYTADTRICTVGTRHSTGVAHRRAFQPRDPVASRVVDRRR